MKCKTTGAIYIGNTQQKFKNRMSAHYNDVQKLISKGKKSDSFTNHFASRFEPGTKPSPGEMREKMAFLIIWKGNPIAVNKPFGTKNETFVRKNKQRS